MSKILHSLLNISRCGGQYRKHRLEPWNMNSRQASLLLEICATPGISQDTLARRVYLDKSVVARMLAGLEEQGFVERPTSQKDRRVICLHPTEKALQLQPQLQGIWTDCEAYLTAGMTGEEMAVLESMLDRLQARAEKWAEEEA